MHYRRLQANIRDNPETMMLAGKDGQVKGLQLSQVSQQCGPLVRRYKTTIYHEAGRRKNRRQVGWRTQPRPAAEHGVVVVQHLLERCRGVVVKIRSGLAGSAQLGDVHRAEVGRLAREKQSS